MKTVYTACEVHQAAQYRGGGQSMRARSVEDPGVVRGIRDHLAYTEWTDFKLWRPLLSTKESPTFVIRFMNKAIPETWYWTALWDGEKFIPPYPVNDEHTQELMDGYIHEFTTEWRLLTV